MIFRIRYGSSMDCKPEPGETEVVISENVTEIELCVFQKCKNLITITVPDDVRFFSCQKLGQIAVPESVTTIEKRAFCNCRKLREITIPKGVICSRKR